MDSSFRFVTDPHDCMYLPGLISQMEYELATDISREKVQERLQQGWRRRGDMLFRPVCKSCNACQSLRVVTAIFAPNRSQRRVIKANQNTVLHIQKPLITAERVELYVLHHNHHAEQKDWQRCTPRQALEQIRILSMQMYIEEWSYYIDGALVAVNYVDVLEEGLSGVYFYHHPDYRQYSLGTWCVISMILRARDLGMPYAYLGFYVAGCRSMEYKGRFGPAQVLSPEGIWIEFQNLA